MVVQLKACILMHSFTLTANAKHILTIVVCLLSHCMKQIRAFAEADVLIGVHGAGLSNMLYMKPNSAVVELGPYGNDARCLLGGGPFSRTAAVMSHNYMIHHPPYEEYKWMADRTAEFNVSRFVVHIDSFLRSLGRHDRL